MKKICVFCETWASGGIESFLCRMLTQMDRTDLQIHLVTAQMEDSVFTSALKQTGIQWRELSGSKGRWLANCRAFFQLLKDEKYDVVHVNAFQGLQLVYLWLAKCTGVPVRIAHSHGSDLRKSPLRNCKMLLHHAGKMLFGGTATVQWACSGRAADFLFRHRGEAGMIPNGIAVEQFRFCSERREAVRTALGLHHRFVIGSVGRLQYDKNQSFLLDVLAEMSRYRPESTLLLVGDGPAKQELRRKAEALGISDRVIFYGVSDHPEELLWAMDAFAFPSLSEGLGIVAVEAQAAGLRVICSEHIPAEANLTPLFQTVPLTAGVSAWVDALLRTTDCKQSRKAAADAVRQAGFEVSGVAELVRSAYVSK